MMATSAPCNARRALCALASVGRFWQWPEVAALHLYTPRACSCSTLSALMAAVLWLAFLQPLQRAPP